MSKIELNETNSGYNLQKINDNFSKIEDEFNDKVLYRDNPVGEPNEMLNDLDMNGNRVYNLPVPAQDHEAARLKDVQNAIADAAAANLVSFEPYKSLESTNVQGAIQELEDDLIAISNDIQDLEDDLLEISNDFVSKSELASDTGAGMVGYKQQGLGAIDRILPDKISESVSFADFGAKEDDIDQTAHLQAAIDSGAYKIDGQGKTYRIDDTLVLRSNLVIENVKFNFRNAIAGKTMLLAEGVLSDTTPISNVTRGAVSLNTNSPIPLTQGEFLYVSSNNKFGQGMTTNGELAEVLNASGNTISLYRRIQDVYSLSPIASKVSFIENIVLRNVSMVGSGDGFYQVAIHFYLCRNVSIENCYSEYFADRCMNVLRCADVTVSGLKSFHSDTSTGLAYGVVIGNGCERITLTGNTFRDHRHGISIGAENGVDRYITVTGNSTSDCTDGGIDCHPGAQFVTIVGNAIGNGSAIFSQDGLVVQCANATIMGNTIQGFNRIGILLQDLGGTHGFSDTHSIISGNVITQPIGVAQVFGIFVENQRVAPNMRVSVTNNTIDLSNVAQSVGISLEIHGDGSDIRAATISNNIVYSRDGCIAVNIPAGKLCTDLSISGNSLESLATTISDAIQLYADSSAGIEKVIIVGNLVKGGRYSLSLNNASRVKADANMFQNFGTSALFGALVGTNDNYTT